MKALTLLAGLSATALLLACGGGGSSSSSSTQATSSVAGVVAYGAPVTGTQVNAIDSKGKQCGTAITDSGGHYTMTTTCAAGAVIFTVAATTPGGAPLDALAFPGAGQALVGGTVNVTPLTTLAVWCALGNLRLNLANHAQVLAMAPALLTSPAYRAASDTLLSALGPLLAPYGINASSFDPVATAFQPNGSGIDGFFDACPLSLLTQASIQIAPSDNPGAPFLVITVPLTANSPATFGGTLAEFFDNSGSTAPPATTPIPGTVIATTPNCTAGSGPKQKYAACNGFSVAELTRGMSNYSAELAANGSTSFLNVHSHDPVQSLASVGAGDSWSSGRNPNPPSYYIDNNGDAAGYTWTTGSTGSVGFRDPNYKIVVPSLSEIDTNVQVFLGNIRSQLSNSLHGKLVKGDACKVAGIDGTTYLIVVTSPVKGEFVHSAYCVGEGGGPLLSSRLYLGKDVLWMTWTVTQVGGVPRQTPPQPWTKL